MKSCQEISQLLGRFVALELAPDAEAEVRAHLAACSHCRARLDEAEPIVGMALRLAEGPVASDPGFVDGVLAGVHQRRVEQQLRRRFRSWAAAAAGLLLVVGGYLALRSGGGGVEPLGSQVAASEEAPFVEVEGEGVTVYQFAPASDEAVAVAMIIDPGLAL